MPAPSHCLNCTHWGNPDDRRRGRALRLCKVRGTYQYGHDGCGKWANAILAAVRGTALDNVIRRFRKGGA